MAVEVYRRKGRVDEEKGVWKKGRQVS